MSEPLQLESLARAHMTLERSLPARYRVTVTETAVTIRHRRAGWEIEVPFRLPVGASELIGECRAAIRRREGC